MRSSRLVLVLLLCALMVASFALILPVTAGERVLTVNNGTESAVAFTAGEPTLVMNGFDLTPLEIVLPAVIDRVTLDVETPIPGQTSELVIYQDVNGGSPVDATLIGRQTISITSIGTVRFTLNQPVTVTAPVVWIGFYLPPDFRFFADTSGSSVLTYWGWTPGGTFDLANLSTAGVLGPSDGSAPVGFDLEGKARITAEITSANPLLGTPVVMQAYQTTGNPNADLSNLATYPDCEDLQFDNGDISITYGNGIDIFCDEIDDFNAPPTPNGFQRRGELYNVFIYTDRGIQPNLISSFITHCVKPEAGDLERAVVGVAYGQPRVWRILPSQRFGDRVCIELPHEGNVSYFVPTS